MARQGRTVSGRRSSRDWAARITLALGAAVLGYFSVTSSLANVIVKADPSRAHVLSPHDATITAALAEHLFMLETQAEPTSRPARLAERALRQDPTAVEALSVLGFQARLRGDTERADQLFAYSGRLSRRELRSQIWAIEEAVARGDIEGALRHYDIALKTSANGQNILFPVLVSALREPRIRASVLRIMATRPSWGRPFVAFVAESGIDPDAAVHFFREGSDIPLPVGNDSRATLIRALLAQNKLEDAWNYYASFRSNTKRTHSRDPNFSLAADAATPFDWTIADESGISAVILKGPRGGFVDFAVSPSNSGPIVTQIQLLPPGSYRLRGHSNGLEQPEQSQPYWSLICQDGRELGRVPVPNSSKADGVFTGRFTVPQGCPIQTLSLVARPTDSIGGMSGQIDSAQLLPVN